MDELELLKSEVEFLKNQINDKNKTIEDRDNIIYNLLDSQKNTMLKQQDTQLLTVKSIENSTKNSTLFYCIRDVAIVFIFTVAMLIIYFN